MQKETCRPTNVATTTKVNKVLKAHTQKHTHIHTFVHVCLPLSVENCMNKKRKLQGKN